MEEQNTVSEEELDLDFSGLADLITEAEMTEEHPDTQKALEELKLEFSGLEEKRADIQKALEELNLKKQEFLAEKKWYLDETKKLFTLFDARRQEVQSLYNSLQKSSEQKKLSTELYQWQEKLARQETELRQKEEQLILREKNAENGFAIQQKEAVKAAFAELDSLRKQIQQKKSELEQLEEKIKQEEQEFSKKRTFMIEEEKAYREQLHTETIKSAEAITEQAQKDAEKIRDSAAKTAEQIKNAAYQTVTQNEVERQKIVQKLQEIKSKEQQLNEKISAVETMRSELQNSVETKVIERYQELFQKIANYQQNIDILSKENSELRKQNQEYQISQRSADGRTTEELVQEVNQLQEELNAQKRANYQLSVQSAEDSDIRLKAEQYENKERECLNLQKEINNLNKKLQQVQYQQASVAILQNEKDTALKLRDSYKVRADALSAAVSLLEQQVNSLKEMAERPAERDARIRDITGVAFTEKNTHFLPKQDEISWLEMIYENLKASHIEINKRLLYAFHTALKTAEWSPITVLAGVSGTGKSLLPKLYARFGGFYFMSLAVQPDWDSSQSLFGFFNALDNKFNATRLLSAMVQFQKDNPESLSDSMMIVLLDEMNLAHVELYFSELLSKLEDRRGEKNEICIDVDLGSGLAKYEVELSRNILWVGTMNEDETTKSLSDKVIDRSNMLSFPSPKEFARRTSAGFAPNSDGMLSKEQWNSWIQTAVRFDEQDEVILKYKTAVEKINKCLNTVGRALGHRVWQAVENYISNHPLCIRTYQNREAEPDAYDKATASAFEEAVVYKIMPKLRGIEITPETKHDCFEPIGRILSQHAGGIVSDYNTALREDQFVWKTSGYLNAEETDAGDSI